MLFKVVHHDQMHSLNAGKNITHAKILEFVRKVFKNLPQTFVLASQGADGNFIYITNDSDLRTVIGSGVAKLQLQVKEPELYIDDYTDSEGKDKQSKSESQGSEDPIPLQEQREEMELSSINSFNFDCKEKQVKGFHHENIQCDNCFCESIVGVRYKCVICQNFDLCSECEMGSTHEHPLLKIKTLGQTPVKIMVVLGDEYDLQRKQIFETSGKGDNLFGSKKSMEQQRKIQIANYLTDTANIRFEAGIMYAKRFPNLSKEKVLMKFLENK